MKVIITGGSGMLGQSVLKECIKDNTITQILSVAREPLEYSHEKVREIILNDFFNAGSISDLLRGYDACFFCAGISSTKMGESEYRKITVDMTLAFASEVLDMNPDISFTYISAHGSDSSSKTMWARVKGEAEEKLQKMGFKNLYIFRPAYTHPEKGIEIKSGWNRRILFFTRPLYRILKTIFPKHVTTTSKFGKAMILTSLMQPDRIFFEVPDINGVVNN